jgi:hypothetical protein
VDLDRRRDDRFGPAGAEQIGELAGLRARARDEDAFAVEQATSVAATGARR